MKPMLFLIRFYALFSIFTLFIMALGCDDTTEGLSPLDPSMLQQDASQNTSPSTVDQGISVPNLGGQELGGQELGGQDGGSMMEMCQECTSNCPPIDCECSSSMQFNGCQEGCCVERSDELCQRLCASVSPPQCQSGDTQCVDGAPTGIQRCDIDGQWRLEACPEQTVCTFDQCLPAQCEEGELRCLDVVQLLECQNGEWVEKESCETGACVENECLSIECASAALEQSYLGCEYLAVELPNGAVPSGPEENHPPMGIVITNPSPNEPAYITIRNPQGQPSSYVQQRQIPVRSDLAAQIGAQTVQSEIKDAQGNLVELNAVEIDQVAVPPLGSATFLMPRTLWNEGSRVEKNAYLIRSSQPIGAYQFTPYCCNYSFSNDASLLIPTSALGTSYRFVGLPHLYFQDLLESGDVPSTLAIVASEDQTTVRFALPPNGMIQPDQSNRLSFERGSYTTILDKQDTLILRTQPNSPGFLEPIPRQPDLSGMFIESSSPVAVLSGHECTFYPSTIQACDHVEEQLFPVDTWGQVFALVPPKERDENSTTERIYWKIVGSSPETRLRLSVPLSELQAEGPGSPGVPDCTQNQDPMDPQTLILGPEGFCEFSVKRAFELSSDQSIMVMGIISGQNSVRTTFSLGERLGDPAIFMVPPLRQLRRDYAFITPNTYYNDYVTLTFQEGSTLYLNDEEIDLSGAQNVLGSPVKYLHLPIQDGPHRLNGNAPFGILVFAYDDFVSFAFTGGLNLTKR